jgi:biopolymer transport protein ExbD
MRRHRHRRVNTQDAELDITSFMNLMIVLVPVLLLSLVFSHVRILNLQLPVLSESELAEDQKEPKILELVITEEYLALNYPAGILLKRFEVNEQGYHFAALSIYLQDLKLTFQQNTIEKNDIVILLEPSVDYQTIVSAMDTVRSFKAVVAANLVDAELFPLISLGDAPTDEPTSETRGEQQ